MTQSVAVEMNSVTGQDEKLDIPFMRCPVVGKNVSKRECMNITVDVDLNKRCINHKCPSPFKACPSCLKFGDIKEMGHIGPTCCEKRKDLCTTHLLWGAGARRSISERVEELLKYEKKLKETQVVENEIKQLENSRKEYLQKEVDKKRKESHQNAQQYKENNKSQQVGMAKPSVPQPVAPKIETKSVPVVIDAVQSQDEKEVMLTQTIVVMSQVEMEVAPAVENGSSLHVATEEYPSAIKSPAVSNDMTMAIARGRRKQKVKKPELAFEENNAAADSSEKFPCIFKGKGREVTKQECTSFCSVFANNRKCQELKCKSPWLICIACIGHGEYPRYGEECFVSGIHEKTGQILCSTHLEIGFENRREGAKKSTLNPGIDLAKISPVSSDLHAAVPRIDPVPRVDIQETKTDSEYVPVEKSITPPATNIQNDVPGIANVNLENGYRLMVKTSEVRVYAKQPRKTFNEERLGELANSIKNFKQKTPVTVRLLNDGGQHKYELINGERRFRACQLAGSDVWIVIDDVTDEKQQYLDSVLANYHGQPHTPIETAEIIKRLRGDEYKFTYKKISMFFNEKCISWVVQHLSLLELHPEVQKMMDESLPKEEAINFSIGVELAKVKDKNLQLLLAQEIVKKKMKTSTAQFFVRKNNGKDVSAASGRKRRPNDDFKLLKADAERCGEKVIHFLAMEDEMFAKLFMNRPPEHRKQIMEQYRESARNFERLIARIESL